MMKIKIEILIRLPGEAPYWEVCQMRIDAKDADRIVKGGTDVWIDAKDANRILKGGE